MVRKTLLKIIIVPYVGLLLLPTIQMGFNLFHYEQIDEARVRNGLPVVSVERLIHDFKGIVSDFEAWFNDNYGFRDLLIRLGTQGDYSFFQYSEKVHIGRKGFLFYRYVSDDELFGNHLVYKSDGVKAIYKGLMDISDRLRKRGIRLVLILNPLKPALYHEFLPNSAPYKEDLCFRDLNELLKNQTDIIYIDVLERLLALKGSMRVFHKTDFHWTDPAAFFIAKEVVNTIGKASNRGEKIWKHSLEIEQAKYSGGEARFMPLLVFPQENSIFVKRNWTENGIFDYTQKKLYEFIYHSREKKGVLPTTVFLGNSFGDGLTDCGMHTYFKNYYRANSWHVKLGTVVDNLPGDTEFFILQTIETKIPCLIRDDCSG